MLVRIFFFFFYALKIEEGDASKSSVKGKKPIMKKVMEYCYELEMEEVCILFHLEHCFNM